MNYFSVTIFHEFIHILDFSYFFFDTYIKNNITKIDIYGNSKVYLNSPKLLEIARKYYNCNWIEGIELEEFDGDGTVGSHWEEI